MKKFLRIISLILCVTTVLLFSSCGESNKKLKKASAEIDDSVTLKLPVCSTDSLNPYKAVNSFNRELASLLFEGLVKINNDFSTTNVIASSIKVTDTTVSVEIGNDKIFSDGSRITAADVEYSYNLAKMSESFQKQLFNFESISASGSSVTFTLKKPDRFASSCLDFPIVKDGSDEDEGVIIGSGKYKIENSETLIMNEKWANPALPKVRRIKLVNLLDATTALKSVESGAISYYFQNLNEGIFTRTNSVIHEQNMTNLVFIGINSNNDDLKKAEVRQAISLVIPKNDIVEETFLGFAEVAKTPFHPNWGELKKVVFEKDDVETASEEAVELMRYAGYEETEGLSGNLMTLKLVVNSENSFKSAAADKIAKALDTIGISTEIKRLSFEEYKKALSDGDFDLYIGETVLSNNMSLSQFFSYNGGATYGINMSSKIISMYDDFIEGKITAQRFTDYFNVAVPFVPVCFRNGLETYTNEMSIDGYGSISDRYEKIYSWYY